MNRKMAALERDEYLVAHGTFSLERTYPAPPARVFSAFADEVSTPDQRCIGWPE